MTAQPECMYLRSSRDTLVPGTIIDGRYRIVGTLGYGGMGIVFEAEHLHLGSMVALKVLRTDGDDRAPVQLLREARLTAGLSTDHVVRVSDCGFLDDGTPFVVMERLRGEDLRQLLTRENQLSVQVAVRLLLQVCAGLADLHAVGIVHRDLKPANVFVMYNGASACRCKLLDLGIARHASSDTSRASTISGSLRYMAPEQLTDSKWAAPQTDVYAGGVIMYRCLTGMLPHDGETVEEIMFSILNREPRSVSETRPEVSPSLAALVSRAIARDPAKRPASAAEFSEELSAFLVEPTPGERRINALDATRPDFECPQLGAKKLSLGLGRFSGPHFVAVLLFSLSTAILTKIVAAPVAVVKQTSASTATTPLSSLSPPAASPEQPAAQRTQWRAERPTQKLDIAKQSVTLHRSANTMSADLGLEKNPYAQ